VKKKWRQELRVESARRSPSSSGESLRVAEEAVKRQVQQGEE